MADVIINNNGTLADLDKQLVVLYDKWIRPWEEYLTKAQGTCDSVTLHHLRLKVLK